MDKTFFKMTTLNSITFWLGWCFVIYSCNNQWQRNDWEATKRSAIWKKDEKNGLALCVIGCEWVLESIKARSSGFGACSHMTNMSECKERHVENSLGVRNKLNSTDFPKQYDLLGWTYLFYLLMTPHLLLCSSYALSICHFFHCLELVKSIQNFSMWSLLCFSINRLDLESKSSQAPRLGW